MLKTALPRGVPGYVNYSTNTYCDNFPSCKSFSYINKGIQKKNIYRDIEFSVRLFA